MPQHLRGAIASDFHRHQRIVGRRSGCGGRAVEDLLLPLTAQRSQAEKDQCPRIAAFGARGVAEEGSGQASQAGGTVSPRMTQGIGYKERGTNNKNRQRVSVEGNQRISPGGSPIGWHGCPES